MFQHHVLRFNASKSIKKTTGNAKKKQLTNFALSMSMITKRYFLVQYLHYLSLSIQSDCSKIRTRKNSIFGHFLRSVTVRAFPWFIPSDLVIHCIHNKLVKSIVLSNILEFYFMHFL